MADISVWVEAEVWVVGVDGVDMRNIRGDGKDEA